MVGSRIAFLIEATTLYSQLRLDRPWDSPVNHHLMRAPVPEVQIPGVKLRNTTGGYSLMHYMGNPNVFHRLHSVGLEDMTSGTSNSWLVGEVDGKYQPWGYPFNWRPLERPFNQGDGSYGTWPDGLQMCFADGSVRFLSNQTHEAVIRSLITAPPVASLEQTEVPKRTFIFSDHTFTRQGFESEEHGRLRSFEGLEIIHDGSGRPSVADLSAVPRNAVYSKDGCKRIDLVGVIQDYPGIRELIYRNGVLDDFTAKLLVGLQKLESLYVGEITITSEGLTALQSLPYLKTVVYIMETENAKLLRAQLTNCTFHGPDPLMTTQTKVSQ